MKFKRQSGSEVLVKVTKKHKIKKLQEKIEEIGFDQKEIFAQQRQIRIDKDALNKKNNEFKKISQNLIKKKHNLEYQLAMLNGDLMFIEGYYQKTSSSYFKVKFDSINEYGIQKFKIKTIVFGENNKAIKDDIMGESAIMSLLKGDHNSQISKNEFDIQYYLLVEQLTK